jgi:hypothetical protein
MEGRQLVMVLAPKKSGRGARKVAQKSATKKRTASVKVAKPPAEAGVSAEVEKK